MILLKFNVTWICNNQYIIDFLNPTLFLKKNFRGTENLHLAVLHPRKIAVYKVAGLFLSVTCIKIVQRTGQSVTLKKLVFTNKINVLCIFQWHQGLWNMAGTFSWICLLSTISREQPSISVMDHLVVLKVLKFPFWSEINSYARKIIMIDVASEFISFTLTMTKSILVILCYKYIRLL